MNSAKPARPPKPRGGVVEQTVAIDAPADVVWEVLADVDGWGAWNSVYPQSSGSVGVGDRIDLTIALPGMKPQKSSCRVFHSSPGDCLQFGTPAMGGLVHATRYIEIDEVTPESCTVVNGEVFGRLLGPLLVRMLGKGLNDGMVKQNAGLKATAEAKWDARRGA